MTGSAIFYTALVALAAITITWFACYSVYRLYSGQR
jgi:hypothetical protein